MAERSRPRQGRSRYAEQRGGHDQPSDEKPDHMAHGMENLPERTTCDCRSDYHHHRARIVGFTSPDSYDGADERAEDHHPARRHERSTKQVKGHPGQVERQKCVSTSFLDPVATPFEAAGDDTAQDHHTRATYA